MTDYRSMDGENWSRLKHLDVSPLFYQYARRHEKQTRAMVVGSATHCITLEGVDVFEAEYVTQPDFGPMQSSTNRAKRDEWAADQTKTVLTADEYDLCHRIREGVWANPEAVELLNKLESIESHYTWTDPDTGILCKAKPDGITPHEHVNFKTTSCRDPEHFGRDFFRRLYHGQTAFYIDGDQIANRRIRPLPEVVVAVQNFPPFDCWVLPVPDVVVEEGRDLYARLLSTLKECRERDYWPGAVPVRQELHVPAWAIAEDDDLSGLELEGF